MRSVYCTLFLIILFINATAQTRYWVGPSGGSWSSTSNWSLTSNGTSGASSPVVVNDVVFDNAFNGIVDMDVLGTTAFSINSLKVTANASVTLQKTLSASGGTRVLKLMSTSNLVKGLQIDNGSTLIIDAKNTSGAGTLVFQLSLTGAAGVAGEISGNLFFTGTTLNQDEAELQLQLDATHYAALFVKNQGLIKYFPNTGTTSPGTGSYLTMENGSTYELNKNGGSFPPGNWDPNSLARVTGTTSNGPLFNGTQYGNFEWNCPGHTSAYGFAKSLTFNNVDLVNSNGTAIRIKTGASVGVNTITINGDLTIGSNALLELTGSTVSIGNGGRINLKGNFVNQGIFTTSGTAGRINDFELNGTVNQNITNTGNFTGSLLIFIQNNSAGTTLLTPLTLPYNLTLTNGKIHTTDINLLTLSDNGNYTGGSSTSFVEGPMKKMGDDNFIFPIGVGSIYAPLGITNVSGTLATTDAFTATYKRSNPQSAYGTSYASGINHISYVEYWELEKNSGNADLVKNVLLTATQYSFAKTLAATFVSHFTGGVWTKEPSLSAVTGTVGVFETGTVTTTAGINTFSPFTLATDQPFSGNPLPLQLIKFNAEKTVLNQSLISWELAATSSRNAKFEVERSSDKKSFSTIATLPGSETNRFYSFNDTRLLKGINYYRLKIIDEDGKLSYSKIVVVINDNTGLLITSVTPNPVQDKAALSISIAQAGLLQFSIVDLSGKKMKDWQHSGISGANIVAIPLEGLSAGVYTIVGRLGTTKTVFRFIKQ